MLTMRFWVQLMDMAKKSDLFTHSPGTLSPSQMGTNNGWCNSCLVRCKNGQASFDYWLRLVIELG